MELRDSEHRYRRLFQSARDGILILDAATLKIIDANHFMSELLGYSLDEFLGKELWEIGFSKDKAASQQVYRELQETGYARYDHLPLESKTGAAAPVEVICNTYQVDRCAVAQCNIRDISERRRMEKKLLEQGELLADLDRRKDEFLAMLSHELRNPLAPISDAVHLLNLQKEDDPARLRARAIIERQLGQMTRLVDDLMEVSRINTGQVRLRHDHVAINEIVERAVEATRPLVNQHRHRLTVLLPPHPIWLYADATRLEQVVVNLLTNAAKYTEDAGRIWLSASEEGDECVLRLRDSGVGIAPELLPRIFDLFAQAETSLDRSHGGLGIGLALVKRLVESHRGKIEVTSVLGEGSEFTVRLPLGLSRELQAPSIPAAAAKPAVRSLRVLIVDDNVDAAESLAMLVAALGHDVRTAYEGVAALQTAIECRPDLMLMDIGLPGLNGYELAARLRQLPDLRNIVLVATTGYSQESDRKLSRDAGFDHHLVKPADFGKVQQILAGVAEKAG
jgi:PAS domain S-box-containing protein